MTIQKKQLIFILIILLAVIGLVGSGCLKNNDDDSSNGTGTGDNSQNSTPPSNNNTSNNTTNNTNNTTNTPPTSGLPDVVYATPGSGGGRGNSAPTEITSKVGDQTVVVEEYEGDEPNTYNVYVYVPAADIVTDDILSITFLKSVDSVVVSAGSESVLKDAVSNGKSVTVKAAVDEPGFGTWDTPNLEVKIGDDTYYVSFFASSVWNFDVAKGGQVSIVETVYLDRDDKIVTVKGSAKKTVVAEPGETRITIKADKGMAGALVIEDSEGNPVECRAEGYTSIFTAESKIYSVKTTFETAVKASLIIDGKNQNIIVDQNLVENGNIFLYVPAEDILGEKILLKFNSNITSLTVRDNLIFSGDVAGVRIIGFKDIEATMSETNKVTQKGGVNPNTISFVVETENGTYNVYLLASALLNFEIPEGYTLTVDNALDLEAGKHSFVTDVGKQHTFSFTPDGENKFVLIGSSDGEFIESTPHEYTFLKSQIYTITIVERIVG
ncbi:hypothetical protein [Methanimicrococcus blatticola]|uniref:Uncharacterized protein n=1 Tax=Methanimicrococcus blatticola TaxID=91560 RepID=A0A484F652_9EURY|nr:hypothetical protein [Methanimicrococcus blatticola]MBZ3936013.1 hypothetical protein [Methanimicrococcus blatticola]MCC2509374.1 hypothetical protein [Methanimicrococcus blatticola]TDQ68257.1 hypothetical protein C7391_1196 [Methanimicrococcus blatticola]